MKQVTKEQAIALAQSNWWEYCSAREAAEFQLSQRLLCMNFSDLHRVVTEALGRDVYTREFGSKGGLLEELLGNKPAPTLDEILNLIPADKRIIIQL